MKGKKKNLQGRNFFKEIRVSLKEKYINVKYIKLIAMNVTTLVNNVLQNPLTPKGYERNCISKQAF